MHSLYHLDPAWVFSGSAVQLGNPSAILDTHLLAPLAAISRGTPGFANSAQLRRVAERRFIGGRSRFAFKYP